MNHLFSPSSFVISASSFFSAGCSSVAGASAPSAPSEGLLLSSIGTSFLTSSSTFGFGGGRLNMASVSFLVDYMACSICSNEKLGSSKSALEVCSAFTLAMRSIDSFYFLVIISFWLSVKCSKTFNLEVIRSVILSHYE